MAVLGGIMLYLNMSGTVAFFKGDIWYYVSGLMLILGVVLAIGALIIGASGSVDDATISVSSLTPPSESIFEGPPKIQSKPSGLNITFSSAPTSNVSSDAKMTVMPGEAIVTSRSAPGLAGMGFSTVPTPLTPGYGRVGLH